MAPACVTNHPLIDIHVRVSVKRSTVLHVFPSCAAATELVTNVCAYEEEERAQNSGWRRRRRRHRRSVALEGFRWDVYGVP